MQGGCQKNRQYIFYCELELKNLPIIKLTGFLIHSENRDDREKFLKKTNEFAKSFGLIGYQLLTLLSWLGSSVALKLNLSARRLS